MYKYRNKQTSKKNEAESDNKHGQIMKVERISTEGKRAGARINV